jgi:hypothetical protein
MDDTPSKSTIADKDAAVRDISDWIIYRAIEGIRIEALLEGVCELFDATVAPLARGHVAISTLPRCWKPRPALGVAARAARVRDLPTAATRTIGKIVRCAP